MGRVNSIYELEDILPPECIADIAQGGDNEGACFEWAEKLPFTITRKAAIEELRGYGAWTLKELESMPMCDLKLKLLWIAAWNVKENH